MEIDDIIEELEDSNCDDYHKHVDNGLRIVDLDKVASDEEGQQTPKDGGYEKIWHTLWCGDLWLGTWILTT